MCLLTAVRQRPQHATRQTPGRAAGRRIELLVVTRRCRHIGGMRACSDPASLEIGEVWFNGYSTCPVMHRGRAGFAMARTWWISSPAVAGQGAGVGTRAFGGGAMYATKARRPPPEA